MLSMQMFAFVTERMEQWNIDFDKIGIVFIRDPAHILPIGADPLWCARLHTDQDKDCSSISIVGMSRFRKILNFSPQQNIPGYDKWQGLRLPKIAFSRKKLMQGNLDTVFLTEPTEVKRTDADPIGKILLNLRYGVKCREKKFTFFENIVPRIPRLRIGQRHM